MTQTHDPQLQALFAQSQAPIEDDGFSQNIYDKVLTIKKKEHFIRWVLFLAFLVLASFFHTQVIQFGGLLNEALNMSILNIQSPILAAVFVSINNIAVLLGLLFLLVRHYVRKIY